MAFAIAPVAIGAALGAGAGLLGSKKPAQPQIDIAALNRLARQGAANKQGIIAGLNPQLQPLTQNYQNTTGNIGTDLVNTTQAQGQEYLKNIEKTGQGADQQRFNLAQEQTFRNLPQVQQAIRESLAGTGGLGRGYAATELAKAPLQAAQNLSDLTKELSIGGAERRGQALDRVYQTNTGAQLAKVGIDKDTANTLLETGRSDILNQAAQLLGVEDQLTNDLFGIQQLALTGQFAKAGAENTSRDALVNALAGISGSLIGKGVS